MTISPGIVPGKIFGISSGSPPSRKYSQEYRRSRRSPAGRAGDATRVVRYKHHERMADVGDLPRNVTRNGQTVEMWAVWASDQAEAAGALAEAAGVSDLPSATL